VALTKAVIPAAGFGTRFLPATKAQQKVLLPVVDTPAIQLVVEEASRAGLSDVLIVTGRDGGAIADHFDRSIELEAFLEAKGKTEALRRVRSISDLADVHYVRQQEARGLGHAVSMGEHHVGDEPFAVLLADDLIHPSVPLLPEMLKLFEERGRSIVAALDVGPDEIGAYGAIETGPPDGQALPVRSVVEKPDPGSAPSTLASIGRYVFTPGIFDALRRIEPGVGGELQLTDAITLLAADEGVDAYAFDHGRFDAGNPLDQLKATVELALERDDIGPAFREWLARFVWEHLDDPATEG
jgi:UTP--glucose-1-phosphate uridylyltransferase